MIMDQRLFLELLRYTPQHLDITHLLHFAMVIRVFVFIFSYPEQLKRWPCHSLSHSLNKLTLLFFTYKEQSKRHLIRAMRRHDLTNTMTVSKTKAMTKTFREHLQGAILETCDLWDICSEWWGDLTKKKTMTNTNTKTKTLTKTNTSREHHQRMIQTLVTFQTFDRSDEEIWPEQKIQWQRQIQRQRQWQRQIHLENTIKERP